jgi:hypothetical protein
MIDKTAIPMTFHFKLSTVNSQVEKRLNRRFFERTILSVAICDDVELSMNQQSYRLSVLQTYLSLELMRT